MVRLILPLHITLARKKGKGKVISLSRNSWEGLHYRVKHQVKCEVQRLVGIQLDDVATPLNTPVTVEMWLYPSHSTCDLGNFCDVISKIVQDSVVSYGCIADDTVKYIKHEIRHAEPCDGDPRLVLEYKGCTEVSEKSGNV